LLKSFWNSKESKVSTCDSAALRRPNFPFFELEPALAKLLMENWEEVAEQR